MKIVSRRIAIVFLSFCISSASVAAPPNQSAQQLMKLQQAQKREGTLRFIASILGSNHPVIVVGRTMLITYTLYRLYEILQSNTPTVTTTFPYLTWQPSPQAKLLSLAAQKAVAHARLTVPLDRGVSKLYIQRVYSLPWGQKTKDHSDFAAIRQKLDEAIHGMKDVKEAILEYLAYKRALPKKASGTILCLVGPPGVGKTAVAKAIADALGRAFYRIALGGIHMETDIRGRDKSFVSAAPGQIMQAISAAKKCNPVILLDEIDKLSSSQNGDPRAALLEPLDPNQNKSFRDHYYEFDWDLSEVFFITTANNLQKIPTALRDRLEVIHVPGYTTEEKDTIVENYLIPTMLEGAQEDVRSFQVPDDARTELVNHFDQEKGIRPVKRAVEKLFRKYALSVYERGEPLTITRENVLTLLNGSTHPTLDSGMGIGS